MIYTLGEVFDDLPETKKVEKNPAKKKKEKENCYRVQQRRAILKKKSLH